MNVNELGVAQFAGTLDEWKKTLINGMTFWISGKSPVFDTGIKAATHSPLTHTGMLYQCPITKRWLCLEAQININVRIGSLDYYLTREKVPMVVGLHNDFTSAMFPAMLNVGQSFLDDQYDTKEIGRLLIHTLDPKYTVTVDPNSFICSELEARLLKCVGLELDSVGNGGNTPASLFSDSHMLHYSLFIPQ